MRTLFIWHTPAGVEFKAIQFQPGILEANRFEWPDWVEVQDEETMNAAFACGDLVLIQVIEGKDRPAEGVSWRLGVTMINEPGDDAGSHLRG